VSFVEELSLLVLDKVIIAGLAFYLWHLYQKKKRQDEAEEEKRRELQEQIRRLKKEKFETEMNERIVRLEQQLDRSYWPLSLCMKNDDAVWHRGPSLYEDWSQLPTEAGSSVEKRFLIPNHEKAVKVIEDNFI